MNKFEERLVRRYPKFRQAKEKQIQLKCKKAIRKVSNAHKELFEIQWLFLPTLDHFDHDLDLYYQWINNRNPLWLERGVYSRLVLKGGKVLELSCGDGFNTRNFYSLCSKEVIACDYDPKAIALAKAKHSAENIDFVLSDIRTNIPKGNFENIIWEAAIEYFSEIEINTILKEIKSRLSDDGILSGCSMVGNNEDKVVEQHGYEFSNKEDLLRFLVPYFNNVTVFETIYPDRHNLYFWASDGVLPFAENSSNTICYSV